MRFKVTGFVVLLVICLTAPKLFAQESEWQNLARIQPGTRVHVVERSLKSVQGTFIGFSDMQLTIAVKEKQTTIARDDIYRVNIIGTKRKRNAFIGLAAGAAVGAALVACCVEKESGGKGTTPGAMAGFGGLGALIGAVLPDGGTTIYRDKTFKPNWPR